MANAQWVLNSYCINYIGNPTCIQEFHPISGMNKVYKIISRILASRLSEVTLELLSPNQAAYTKGRLIDDHVALDEEHMQDFGQKSTTRRVCISLDIFKAFDSMN